ncbi:MAG TPA: hypothetical protein PK867_20050 [Pirellulales bacterium]|nr:hypothetical protein [Pirellulales bacterium]
MPASYTGIVRGNSIQFEGELGLPDGQRVSVTLKPVGAARGDAYGQLQSEFNRLSAEWKNATGHLSNISQKTRHPAYQAIIAMGKPAVPLILRDLAAAPYDWFAALEQITGADPVPESSYGAVNKMAKAWLDWGKGQGYDW